MKKEEEKIVTVSEIGEKRPQELQEEQSAAIIWDCGSPLYDSYELASLSHLIDRNMMALPFPCGSKRFNIYQSNFPREEKGLNMINQEGFQQEGLLSKLMSSYSWKRTRDKERNEKTRKASCRFYSLCRMIGLCRKKSCES
ncbi:hypothetical protein P3X46_030140 [Hevea brasiliensis]|uniref:Uncharacterized protein n=1 Tax=Hevea brasiliensis TaxID=3981 RepID=A0ABQ9KVB3_HEVBR|nr:uncharacterized protein LOC110656180 [Hevea brasiliensis]KAJ9148044.1 hypothetical protein P3X46_030140 [Hevea brasiliensis]